MDILHTQRFKEFFSVRQSHDYGKQAGDRNHFSLSESHFGHFLNWPARETKKACSTETIYIVLVGSFSFPGQSLLKRRVFAS